MPFFYMRLMDFFFEGVNHASFLGVVDFLPQVGCAVWIEKIWARHATGESVQMLLLPSLCASGGA
jgi:hypothetical protein